MTRGSCALLVLVMLAPGCVATSWTAALLEPSYPSQEASVLPGSVLPEIAVVVSATDGSGARAVHAVTVDGATRLEDVRVSSRVWVGEGWLDTPFTHIPPPLPVIDVEVRDSERGWHRVAGVPPLSRTRSIPAEALGCVLLPVAVVADVVLFPLEAVLLAVR